MRFSIDWLSDFVTVPADHGTLAARLTMAGLQVEAIEGFQPPSDPTGAPDTVLEIDITSNRPDAMNHLGLAREIAALTGAPLKTPRFRLEETSSSASSAASVAIEAEDLCPRYVGRVVTGARVGPSPARIRRRLEAIGLAPKNNLVDASNYVLFELGQPLHVFDLGRLAGRGVIVRLAREGEKMVTLADQTERTLGRDMLVIADAGSRDRPGVPVAVAGVIGGFDSAISETTTEILIESAWFDPRSVRRTARALGLHTDASHRFERGADAAMTSFAADRLAALAAELSGGLVLSGAIDVRAARFANPALEVAVSAPVPRGPLRELVVLRSNVPILLRSRRLARLLGIEDRPDEIPPLLERIGVASEPVTNDSDRAGGSSASVDTILPESPPRSGGERAWAWRCYPPIFRGDLGLEVDLIEEFARLAGYGTIPETTPEGPGPVPRSGVSEMEDRVRDLLVASGYREAIDYSMISRTTDALFGPIDEDSGAEGPLLIENPLSDRWEAMRRSLLPGLAASFAYNLARGREDLRLFEIGTVHHWGPGRRPVERLAVCAGAIGRGHDPVWPDASPPYDLFDLKGALESLTILLVPAAVEQYGEKRGLPRLEFRPCETADLRHGRSGAPARRPFHPGQSFSIHLDGRRVGRGGRLHPEVLELLEAGRPIFLAEILLDGLAVEPAPRRFRTVLRLNPVERDLSFFVAREMPYARIENEVAAAAGTAGCGDAEPPSFFLIDRFEGGSLPEGRVSYAFRFRFQPRERTLTTEELNAAVDRLASRISASLAAEIRSA